MENVIRVKSFFTGCFDENGNQVREGGGKYIPAGVQYKYHEGSGRYPNHWAWDTDIIYDEHMQKKLSEDNPEFMKLSDFEVSKLRKFEKDTYAAIQKEIMKGSLQERLGYDLFNAVMNHPWERLPEKYKEKFQDFLEKEGEILTINKPA